MQAPGERASAASFVTVNDGTRLAYEEHGPRSGPPLLLLHGWSGSRHSFVRNAQPLADAGCRVICLDQRFHGDSDSPPHGHHVARLAADLRDVLAALDLTGVTVVGTSMGCAVIWSYVELFGTQRLKGAVLVDQAPLQNRAPDWQLGSKGCYDAASLAKLQAQLVADLSVVAAGNVAGCISLHDAVPADIKALLRAETMRCDGAALGALMADHTQLDWRPTIRHKLTIPVLNCVGGAAGCFPVDGCLEVSRLAPSACSLVFARANHWLYLEQPDEFNAAVASFVRTGNEGRPALAHVP